MSKIEEEIGSSHKAEQVRKVCHDAMGVWLVGLTALLEPAEVKRIRGLIRLTMERNLNAERDKLEALKTDPMATILGLADESLGEAVVEAYRKAEEQIDGLFAAAEVLRQGPT